VPSRTLAYGRLENTPLNSGPGACHQAFARQGYVAFSYDMVGYVDNAAISPQVLPITMLPGVKPLWGINLLGPSASGIASVQLISCLPFPKLMLTASPCTGESGRRHTDVFVNGLLMNG